jgi:hypothetical protein
MFRAFGAKKVTFKITTKCVNYSGVSPVVSAHWSVQETARLALKNRMDILRPYRVDIKTKVAL